MLGRDAEKGAEMLEKGEMGTYCADQLPQFPLGCERCVGVRLHRHHFRLQHFQ
jgi:hypothetical protein